MNYVISIDKNQLMQGFSSDIGSEENLSSRSSSFLSEDFCFKVLGRPCIHYQESRKKTGNQLRKSNQHEKLDKKKVLFDVKKEVAVYTSLEETRRNPLTSNPSEESGKLKRRTKSLISKESVEIPSKPNNQQRRTTVISDEIVSISYKPKANERVRSEISQTESGISLQKELSSSARGQIRPQAFQPKTFDTQPLTPGMSMQKSSKNKSLTSKTLASLSFTKSKDLSPLNSHMSELETDIKEDFTYLVEPQSRSNQSLGSNKSEELLHLDCKLTGTARDQSEISKQPDRFLQKVRKQESFQSRSGQISDSKNSEELALKNCFSETERGQLRMLKEVASISEGSTSLMKPSSRLKDDFLETIKSDEILLADRSQLTEDQFPRSQNFRKSQTSSRTRNLSSERFEGDRRYPSKDSNTLVLKEVSEETESRRPSGLPSELFEAAEDLKFERGNTCTPYSFDSRSRIFQVEKEFSQSNRQRTSKELLKSRSTSIGTQIDKSSKRLNISSETRETKTTPILETEQQVSFHKGNSYSNYQDKISSRDRFYSHNKIVETTSNQEGQEYYTPRPCFCDVNSQTSHPSILKHYQELKKMESHPVRDTPTDSTRKIPEYVDKTLQTSDHSLYKEQIEIASNTSDVDFVSRGNNTVNTESFNVQVTEVVSSKVQTSNERYTPIEICYPPTTDICRCNRIHLHRPHSPEQYHPKYIRHSHPSKRIQRQVYSQIEPCCCSCLRANVRCYPCKDYHSEYQPPRRQDLVKCRAHIVPCVGQCRNCRNEDHLSPDTPIHYPPPVPTYDFSSSDYDDDDDVELEIDQGEYSDDYSSDYSESRYIDLPYQHSAEYENLVQELEESLQIRNRNRVQRALNEFEEKSKYNKPLERPIIDYEAASESEEPLMRKISELTEKRKLLHKTFPCKGKACCNCFLIKNENDRTRTHIPIVKNQSEPPPIEPTEDSHLKKPRWQLDRETGEWYKEHPKFSKRVTNLPPPQKDDHICSCTCTCGR